MKELSSKAQKSVEDPPEDLVQPLKGYTSMEKKGNILGQGEAMGALIPLPRDWWGPRQNREGGVRATSTL